ncbi:MAG TPA: hypothetical protein VD862_03400 [Candidatus Paceibacterota bacterium]|nr:hypothetical protein [Candidatus Paceibacterota bacterium]
MLIRNEAPLLLFMGELEEALSRERVALSDEARMYLSGLLTRIRSEHGPMRQTPLAPDYLNALSSLSEQERTVLFRSVGDSALIISGWWWQWLERFRQPMDPAYHAELGERAYRQVEQELFDELADKFASLIDVLARMSARLQTDDRQVMEVYATWLRTQSRHAARLLRMHGIDVRAAGRTRH